MLGRAREIHPRFDHPQGFDSLDQFREKVPSDLPPIMILENGILDLFNRSDSESGVGGRP